MTSRRDNPVVLHSSDAPVFTVQAMDVDRRKGVESELDWAHVDPPAAVSITPTPVSSTSTLADVVIEKVENKDEDEDEVEQDANSVTATRTT